MKMLHSNDLPEKAAIMNPAPETREAAPQQGKAAPFTESQTQFTVSSDRLQEGKSIDLAALEENAEPLNFDPSGIYYDGPTGKYLVDAGQYFRTYSRKSPVVTGVARFFQSQGEGRDESKALASGAVADAEIDQHVEWSGNIAGYQKGLIHSSDGKPMLVLTSPSLFTAASGPAPIISDIFKQALPDQLQRDIFTGWLAGFYRSVLAGIPHPAPMLCLAGEVNAGKSLLAYIVKLVGGGRSANPHTAWTGSLPWNDNLCAAELLLLDDCTGSTDIRSRMKFASNFKEAIYAGEVDMRKRHYSSMSVRPIWRVMVCCNNTAESLLILPPIGNDMTDKVILLKVEPITVPIDTSHVEGKQSFQRMSMNEMPMLADYLMKFELPDNLRDSRSGVLAWRHPDLSQAIESHKPETKFEELILTAITDSHCGLWHDLPRMLSASAIEGRLIHRDSPVRDQVKAVLGTWTAACGTYLSKLASGDSTTIQPAEYDAHKKRPYYWVRL